MPQEDAYCLQAPEPEDGVLGFIRSWISTERVSVHAQAGKLG